MKLFQYIFVFVWLTILAHGFPTTMISDPICMLPHDRTLMVKTFQSLLGVKKLPKRFQKFPTKFTGFRFHKSYQFYHRFFKARKALKISYCKDGHLQFQIEHTLQKEIDWEVPFCIYNAPITTEKTSKLQALNNLHALKCFKLARRKKYAKRLFDIFLPDTWVGGLFHCKVSDDVKKRLILIMDDNLDLGRSLQYGNNHTNSLFNMTNICTRENSTPLQPLMSSDYKQYWTNYKSESKIPLVSQIYKMQVEKIIPFFETPVNTLNEGRINWGFPLEEQFASMFNFWKLNSRQPWYEEIEVQEQYNFGELEQKAVSTMIDKSIKVLEPVVQLQQAVTSSMLNASGLNDKDTKSSSTLKTIIRSVSKWKQYTWDRLGISDRIAIMIGPEAHELSQEIKDLWDNLKVEREKFEYSNEEQQKNCMR
ncbi:uncharacterized protein Ecym_2176 [Eremothecium cymbalariae DBVPG|uniref:Uncharacterized protein n=1 Tax=Eremothecium cymbalariae (strain CBS 270.75 / DBVPG 7215 / KCTC 17166 / NRRL Y-17582) TaxID=931890 RepID=G8JNL1_ERECY|nr:Hypothetical protein Ecym_2176 [Eremothecium cymbalariae DBVPG\